MIAPCFFITSMECSMSASTASLNPKYFRATPMRAPFKPFGSQYCS